MFDAKAIRKQFPIFEHTKGTDSIYFDNAATTHKPQIMLDALHHFYAYDNAPIHRGIYQAAEHATVCYEQARATIASLIGAHSDEIVFTKNSTEGINLVAASWAMQHIKTGDRIVLTEYEHHANLLAWRLVAQKKGAQIVYIPVDEHGHLMYDRLDDLVTSKTKLIACTSVSNALGVSVDTKKIAQAAQSVGAFFFVDAAQQVAHEQISVGRIGADSLVFSGHKLFGPTGIGVVYIKRAYHAFFEPYQLGGAMVFDVTEHDVRYQNMPHMLEAGTPPVAQAIALAKTMQWFYEHDMQALQKHETGLVARCIDAMRFQPSITILGPVEQLQKKSHMLSFIINGMHAHDVAAYLDTHGIAVRAGHHCAQPLAQKLGVQASVRVSFACYNTMQQVETMLNALGALL